MNFEEWCDHHGVEVDTVGSDKEAHFDSHSVGIMPDGVGGKIIVVQDRDSPQTSDYRQKLDEVELTEYGISGDFEGPMGETKSNFQIDDL